MAPIQNREQSVRRSGEAWAMAQDVEYLWGIAWMVNTVMLADGWLANGMPVESHNPLLSVSIQLDTSSAS